MTAPRTALFQRKGTAGDQAGGPPPETGETGEAPMAVCPQCGCEFDPANPEAYAAAQSGMPPEGMPPEAGGGGPEEIAAMLGMGGQ